MATDELQSPQPLLIVYCPDSTPRVCLNGNEKVEWCLKPLAVSLRGRPFRANPGLSQRDATTGPLGHQKVVLTCGFQT